jgi:hypothetical protein
MNKKPFVSHDFSYLSIRGIPFIMIGFFERLPREVSIYRLYCRGLADPVIDVHLPSAASDLTFGHRPDLSRVPWIPLTAADDLHLLPFAKPAGLLLTGHPYPPFRRKLQPLLLRSSLVVS